jgi:hypothetical protein
MIKVKIYKPAKNAMQSGRANTLNWIMERNNGNAQYIEPVMQWTASNNTGKQIRLTFETKEDAVNFAEKNGWHYTLIEPHTRTIKPKSYTGDHFIMAFQI